MKTLISAGDFYELFYRIKIGGMVNILKRIVPSAETRVKKAWNLAASNKRTNWWDVPAVIKRRNKLITGNENEDYFSYLNRKFLRDNSTILSPGCGTGEKELAIARLTNVLRVDAFDLAEKRIAIARKKAAESKIENVNFFVADIQRFSSQKEKYDVIIFDSFLHHVKNIGNTLDVMLKALKPEGLLVINEYVGANRFQWSEAQIAEANKALMQIPRKLRGREFDGKEKRKIYRPGLIRMILADPSEAVNSETILQEIYERFEVVEERPYGGNLLQLVLKDISHNFINENKETLEVLQKLFTAEDKFIEKYRSDFVFGVYRKK